MTPLRLIGGHIVLPLLNVQPPAPFYSTQRLVQLSQANAKLSSESTSARARVIDAEEAVEKAGHDAQVTRGSTYVQRRLRRLPLPRLFQGESVACRLDGMEVLEGLQDVDDAPHMARVGCWAFRCTPRPETKNSA